MVSPVLLAVSFLQSLICLRLNEHRRALCGGDSTQGIQGDTFSGSIISTGETVDDQVMFVITAGKILVKCCTPYPVCQCNNSFFNIIIFLDLFHLLFNFFCDLIHVFFHSFPVDIYVACSMSYLSGTKKFKLLITCKFTNVFLLNYKVSFSNTIIGL